MRVAGMETSAKLNSWKHEIKQNDKIKMKKKADFIFFCHDSQHDISAVNILPT